MDLGKEEEGRNKSIKSIKSSIQRLGAKAVFNAAMLATDLAGPSGPRRALRLLRAVQRLGAAEPNVLSVTTFGRTWLWLSKPFWDPILG